MCEQRGCSHRGLVEALRGLLGRKSLPIFPGSCQTWSWLARPQPFISNLGADCWRWFCFDCPWEARAAPGLWPFMGRAEAGPHCVTRRSSWWGSRSAQRPWQVTIPALADCLPKRHFPPCRGYIITPSLWQSCFPLTAGPSPSG